MSGAGRGGGRREDGRDGELVMADSRSMDARTREFLEMEILLGWGKWVAGEVPDRYERLFGGVFIDDFMRDFTDFIIDDAPERTERGVLAFAAVALSTVGAIVYTLSVCAKGSSVSGLLPGTKLRDELGFDDGCFDVVAGSGAFVPYRRPGLLRKPRLYRQRTVADLIGYVAANHVGA